jgi:hypothetical protein
MGVNINANHLPIFLHYSVHLTPFNAKDMLILRGYFAWKCTQRGVLTFLDQHHSALLVPLRLSDVDHVVVRFQVLRSYRQTLTYPDAGSPEDPHHEVVAGAAGLSISKQCVDHIFFPDNPRCSSNSATNSECVAKE